MPSGLKGDSSVMTLKHSFSSFVLFPHSVSLWCRLFWLGENSSFLNLWWTQKKGKKKSGNFVMSVTKRTKDENCTVLNERKQINCEDFFFSFFNSHCMLSLFAFGLCPTVLGGLNWKTHTKIFSQFDASWLSCRVSCSLTKIVWERPYLNCSWSQSDSPPFL